MLKMFCNFEVLKDMNCDYEVKMKNEQLEIFGYWR